MMTYIPRSSNGKIGATSSIPRVVKKKRTVRVFSFLGTAMIIIAVLVTAGVFFFKNVSEGQLEEAKIRLTEASGVVGDSKAKINEIRMYDEQLKTAARLLENHLAPSLLFDALELNTIETIQYKTFEYEYDPGFEALLTLGGGTEEFASIVLQKIQLDSIDSPFEVAVVEDITKEEPQESSEGGSDTASLYEEGEVVFGVTGLLKKTRFVYTGESTPEGDVPAVPEQEDAVDGEGEDPEDQPDTPNEDNQ